jgi:agmatine/peptidylarginine deiminase
MYRISARQILVIALISAVFAAGCVAFYDRFGSRLQPSGNAASAEDGNFNTAVPNGITDPSVATNERNNIEVYKAVSPGVVFIRSTTFVRDFFTVEEQQGAGSGSIIDEQGHILTNYHVIEGTERSGKLTVSLGDGKNYPARIERGELGFNDWIFNAWGDKYESLKHDDEIPSRLEHVLRVPRFQPSMVLEGGSIDVNGTGLVLTTKQCLLNANRNPQLSRAEIEQKLKDFLGVEKVLWLGEGISGDDTDGHIDDIARFVAEDTIVCALEEDSSDENYEPLLENYERLKRMTDARGRNFNIATLPMPDVISVEDEEDKTRAYRLPASYANFYIANNVVLAPVFGHRNDARAIEILQGLFKTRRVISINCEPLVWGMGTIHCITQQQPTGKI